MMACIHVPPYLQRDPTKSLLMLWIEVWLTSHKVKKISIFSWLHKPWPSHLGLETKTFHCNLLSSYNHNHLFTFFVSSFHSSIGQVLTLNVDLWELGINLSLVKYINFCIFKIIKFQKKENSLQQSPSKSPS